MDIRSRKVYVLSISTFSCKLRYYGNLNFNMMTLAIYTNALHDNLREILSSGKSPSLFFYFTTIPKDLPFHMTILFPLWNPELQEPPWRWLTADLSTPALWVTPGAILLQLQFTSKPSPSWLPSFPACSLPCSLGYWMDCFRAAWFSKKLATQIQKLYHIYQLSLLSW